MNAMAFRSHAGEPLPPDADLFVPPPPEIGEVLSAWTSLRLGTRARPLAVQVAPTFAAAAIGWALGHGLASIGPEHDPALALFGAIALSLGLGSFAWVLVGWFSHRCTYVGRRGIARFRCSGRRDRIVQSEVFSFDDAARLMASLLRIDYHGLYAGTSYRFSWEGTWLDERFAIKGTDLTLGRRPPDDPFHFACAAEAAWSELLLERSRPELERTGFVAFDCGRGRVVRVGREALELEADGSTARWEASDIAAVEVDPRKEIAIVGKGARRGWFSSDGVFRVPYASVPNARALVLAVQRLIGRAA